MFNNNGRSSLARECFVRCGSVSLSCHFQNLFFKISSIWVHQVFSHGCLGNWYIPTFPGVGNSLMTWSIIHPLILYCLVALAVYLVDLVKCPEIQYKFISLLIAQITVQYALVYPHQLSILVSIYRHSNCQRSVHFSTSRLLHSIHNFIKILQHSSIKSTVLWKFVSQFCLAVYLSVCFSWNTILS